MGDEICCLQFALVLCKKMTANGRKEKVTVMLTVCICIKFIHTYEHFHISKRSIDYIGYSLKYFRTQHIFFFQPCHARAQLFQETV